MEGNLKILKLFKAGGFILYWFSENVYSRVSNLNLTAVRFYQINIMLINYLVLSLELHILFSFYCLIVSVLRHPGLTKIHVQSIKDPVI